MAKKQSVKKLVVMIDPEGNVDVAGADAQLTKEVGDAEIATKTKTDEATFKMIVTNPCVYIMIGGVWYRICW